ncbi:hypothetical protein HHK36_018000 [Tetracentron sinense]|uniref:ubiquitinyl hydrolase 1 n=1 Tax=Tetracentron sinense TaxID=13715 RepID=A0A834Z1H7_TETSI|nr:hypothetical protein HHK36_018000 [Tetracentron sinense]
MTRILVQRGSTGSSSNPSRSSLPSSSAAPPQQLFVPQIPSPQKEEGQEEVQDPGTIIMDCCGSGDDKATKSKELLVESIQGNRNESECNEFVDKKKAGNDDVVDSGDLIKQLDGLRITERVESDENEGSSGGSLQIVHGSSYPPPPPVPPPKPLAVNSSSRRTVFGGSGGSSAVRIGSSRRAVAWPVVSTRTSPSGSRPSSPGAYGEGEGYNSGDEQNPRFGSSYDDAVIGFKHEPIAKFMVKVERERQFEIDIRHAKGLEVKRMVEDGNCLFRAVADQVYGDTEVYDLTRQMCIDYMVYGNNMEIQALCEMYNRPILIYSYSTEPINTFHGSYNTDTPPIRLSYHHGNHYNSLVDPRRLTIGAGLGFRSLQGRNIDKDQVKAAIRDQQDQQINNASTLIDRFFRALLAEGRFYSDLELTEKEIERMVMEASRAEYLANDKFKQLGFRESSTSSAEPSSSGATTGPSPSKSKLEGGKERSVSDTVLSSSMQMVLAMGFSYLQVIEAYSIFGDDVDSVVCYLLETTNSSRRKGKATE